MLLPREYNIRPCRLLVRCHPATSGGLLLVLALDTTTKAGSVAVVRDDEVVAQLVGNAAMTYGERLPGELMRTLETAGVALDQLDLLAVAAGPGSFTGLRVGIAAMQGLALARQLKVVPVSTLEALARQAAETVTGPALLASWIDAQRGEVFAALYTSDARDVLAPPSAASPATTLEAWRGPVGEQPVVFAGDGAIRHADVITSMLGESGRILDATPLAGVIGRIATRRPDRAVLPHAIVPVYIRRSDAEIARDARR